MSKDCELNTFAVKATINSKLMYVAAATAVLSIGSAMAKIEAMKMEIHLDAEAVGIFVSIITAAGAKILDVGDIIGWFYKAPEGVNTPDEVPDSWVQAVIKDAEKNHGLQVNQITQ